jgi:hypothetical protein
MFSYLVRMGWSLALMAGEFLAIVREFFEALWGEPRRGPLASPCRARPCLEGLGERIVPTVWVWDPDVADGGAGTTDWKWWTNWKRESDGLRPGNFFPVVGPPNSESDDFVFDGDDSNGDCSYTLNNGVNVTIGNDVTVRDGYRGEISLDAPFGGMFVIAHDLTIDTSSYLFELDLGASDELAVFGTFVWDQVGYIDVGDNNSLATIHASSISFTMTDNTWLGANLVIDGGEGVNSFIEIDSQPPPAEVDYALYLDKGAVLTKDTARNYFPIHWFCGSAR